MGEPAAHALIAQFWQLFLSSDCDDGRALSAVVTPQVQFRGTLGIEAQGAEEIAAYCRRARQVFGGFHAELGACIADGDRMACRLSFSGVHQAELFGVAASGHAIEYDGMAWMTTQDGRFDHIWVMGDAAEWMTRFTRR